MPNLAIEATRLTLGKRQVLADVALTFPEGSHTAILGPNGAGKTSLLKALAGLLPFEGRLGWGERDLGGVAPLERAKIVSYVPQRSLLAAGLVVEEIVAQGRYCHTVGLGHNLGLWRASGADNSAVEAALAATHLQGLRARRYTQLSGGEQRRVLLARALATEAPLLLLDEPTAALDVAHALAFFETLQHLAKRGHTVVTVLHDPRDAERFCGRAAVLNAGRLVYSGPAQLPEEIVEQAYGVARQHAAVARFDRLNPGANS
jgi:iron complex transport system ATP-binding protein